MIIFSGDYIRNVSENQQNICTLPRDVLGRIVTFLVLKEITHFDLAVMNMDHRVSFLAAIKYQRVYLGNVEANFKITIDYILRRGLFLLDLGNLRDPTYSSEEDPLTPLLWAIANIPEEVFTGDGEMKLLDMLTSGVEENVNIDREDYQGLTALMLALIQGHLKAMELLIFKGADLNVKNNGGLAALMLASQDGHVNAMELLIAKGSDVNIMNINGSTALMFASENGHVGAVELLISAGSDVNIMNGFGSTALMHASKNGHISAMLLVWSCCYPRVLMLI
jgi:ankyrin repeat protein